MIPVVALAAISLGIQLSASIISFLVDEKTKEERDKQADLLKEYEKKQKSAEDSWNKFRQKSSEQFASDLEESYDKERSFENNQLKKYAKDDIVSFLKGKAEERLNYVSEQLIKEINNALDTLYKEKKIKYNSSLRYNSFRLLRTELEEAKNKAYAYKNYLKKYISRLSDIYDCCDEAEDIIFSYTLPKTFPYKNKIINVFSEDYDIETGVGYTVIHGCIRIDFFITDYDFYKDQVNDAFSVMMVDFDYKEYRNIYSIQHGRYKQIAKSGGFTGITAKVHAFEKNNIVLIYGKDMYLNLNARYLYNFNRYPAIGSEIVVFPIEEYYSKEKEKIIYNVSQRQEDAEISIDFHKIPLILSKNKTHEFIEYYRNKNVDFSLEYDDVKIAPISESGNDTYDPKKLRIQFGEYFTLVVDIKSYDQKQFLWFDRFIEEKPMSAEDIFVPFNAEIEVLNENDFDNYINDELNLDVFENMNCLILTLFKEFNLQCHLKNSQEGMRYFSAWENITSSLKKYLEKSDSIKCKTVGLPEKILVKNKGYLLKFKIANPEKIRKYYERILSEQENTHYICEFFIEYGKVYYDIEINSDCESFSVIVPDSEIIGREESNNIVEELELLSEVEIFRRNFAVPEQRQLRALHSFKIGNLQNKILQMYMLNANHIIPSCNTYEMNTLFNQSLSSNKSQYTSLTRSLKEENIFFIQGPPGTGKTTVIRELIAQTILNNSQSKILIVSQANVAVDNVIIGLLKDNMPFSANDIIRCGKSGKISSEISDLSYEKKYNNYISSIENLSVHSKDSVVRSLAGTWLSKVKSSHGWNPDVGELIIRNHKIIGATCVGLSQKKIGIDKLSFDLVIIDEAGKALAPEIVIPMIQAKKAVIIGDHKQLPAVINPALYDEEKVELDERQYCKKEIFDVSYFQKLYESCPKENKSSLDTQYRMPSVIGTMISNLFYEGKLKNGVNTEQKKPIYGKKNLCIIDMSNEKEYVEDDKFSPVNRAEAEYVLKLLNDIQAKTNGVKIAVITPYRGQKNLIRRLLLNSKIYHQDNIHIDTVDSFQGDEAEIVIYCTTRSKKRTRFLSDRRRINVAISRTKNEFIMIASVQYLDGFANKEPIKQVLNYIKKNGTIQPPQQFAKAENISTNRDIILIKEIVFNNEIGDDMSFEQKIKQEVEHYNKEGKFSCYPRVDKSDELYIMKGNFEIYYAALQLSLSELIVEVSNTNSAINIKNYSKQIAIN